MANSNPDLDRMIEGEIPDIIDSPMETGTPPWCNSRPIDDDDNAESDNEDQEHHCCENYKRQYELLYMELDHVEDPNDYHVGGLHPVHLGDRLDNDRYRVMHKLGAGAFGTVWLCFDEKESIWRAIKLLTAHGSTERVDPDTGKPSVIPELKAFQLLSQRFTPEVLEENHIACPVSTFTVRGPNGTHLGLVYPLLGCQLLYVSSYLAPCKGLVKEIAFQLVKAMDFLHREAKLCHGDFRPANIMYRLGEGVDKWPEEKMLEVLGQPETENIVLRHAPAGEDGEAEEQDLGPNVPKYIVGAARFDYYSGVLAASVAVSDFGVSFEAANPPSQTKIPPRYCSPEDFLGLAPGPGFTTDVWALMVTILEILTGTGLSHFDDPVDVLRELECIAGPMPTNFREAWKNHEQVFANGEEDPSLPAVVEMWHYEEILSNAAKGLKEDGLLESTDDRSDGAEGGDKNGSSIRLANPRLARLVTCERQTRFTREIYDEVAKHDFRATGLLPKLIKMPRRDGAWKDKVRYQIERKDADLLVDLLSLVFKWQPGDRPLTGEILKHPWFDEVRPSPPALPPPTTALSPGEFVEVSLKSPKETLKVEDGEEAQSVNTMVAAFLGYLAVALQSVGQSWMSCVKPRR